MPRSIHTPPAAAQPLQRRGQGELSPVLGSSPVARLIGEALLVPGVVVGWVMAMGFLPFFTGE
jgi:hypothetical protein